MKFKSLAVVWLLACASGVAFSHGGGLNAEGCHNERRTGGYHCHRGGGAASAKQQGRAHAAAPSQGAPHRPTCYTGPRGGRYTITSSGRKNYRGC